MGNKKYKLAVMGATGVGKTVFFASYFYQTTQLGKGNHPVSIKHPGSVKEIGRIIRKLFEEHSIPEGTATRTDVSFDVDSLGMEVEFYDVPGGHTQDMEQWVDQNILPDLEQANGVLFFISSEDAVFHQDRLVNDNMVFTTAISHLRKALDGKGRQDVPIWFLFTKGDIVPEKTLEELKESIPALLKAAGKKGRFIRCWKVASMGKWISPSAPPKEYEPENVVEPMEEMLETMKRSGGIFTTKVRLITALCILCAWGALMGAGWFFDQYRWKATKSTVDQHMELSRFPDAIEEMKSFYDRFKLPSLLLPSFLSAGPDANMVLNEIYGKYEKDMYKSLAAYVDNVDPNSIPVGNPESFRTAVSKIREYLSLTKFYEIAPGNYDRVRAVESYYETGLILLTNMNEFVTGSTQEEIYTSLKRQLDLASKIPSAWLEKVEVKTDELLRAWVHSFSLEGASPSDLNQSISLADQLLGHPLLSEKLKNYLHAQKKMWESQRGAAWRNLCEGWLQEAGRMEPEKAIEHLAQRQVQQALPSEIKEMLSEAVDMHYARLADEWLAGSHEPDGLREMLARFPYMPFEQKSRVEDRIRSQVRGKIDELLRDLAGAKKIGELAEKRDAVKAAKTAYGENAPVISAAFQASAFRIVENEMKIYADETNALASRQDFGGAKHRVASLFGELASIIRSLGAELENQDSVLKAVEVRKNEMLARIEDAEYAACKSMFNSMRNIREKSEIRRGIERLKGFVSRWPSSPKNQEVLAVQNFLEYIQGGVPVRLVIVDGDFSAASSISDTPDIYIEIYRGDTLIAKTDTIYDKKYPNFNFNYSFEWELTTQLTFRGIEVDVTFDEEVFKRTVFATGLFGYRKLTDSLKSEGNVLNIKLEHSIPACPWE